MYLFNYIIIIIIIIIISRFKILIRSIFSSKKKYINKDSIEIHTTEVLSNNSCNMDSKDEDKIVSKLTNRSSLLLK